MKVLLNLKGGPLERGGTSPLGLPLWLTPPTPNTFGREIYAGEGCVFLEEEFPGASGVSDADSAARLISYLRTNDVAGLHRVASSAIGTFAVIVVCFRSERIACITDSLGVHPLYIDRRSTDTTVIATALSSLPHQGTQATDLAGVLQKTFLGAPLGSRTLLEGVSRLRSGELVVIDRNDRNVIFHSSEFIPDLCDAPEADWPHIAKSVFMEAVDRRVAAVDMAVHTSFLSGGLDSRVLVAELARSCQVRTITFSRSRTQELAFATLFAEAYGIELHAASPPPLRLMDWADLMRGELVRLGTTQPLVAWSGDGGSVGCGAVYCTEERMALFRESAEVCAEAMLRSFGVRLPALLKRSARLREALEQTMEDLRLEVARAQQCNDDRSSHFFFMFTDQHRHLDLYFDRRADHNVSFLLPFFDRRVLEFWLSLPLSPRLYHKLYMKWFDTLGEKIRSTPWQTYPGHVKCPVPYSADFSAQWSPDFWPERTRNIRRANRRGALHSLMRGFSGDVLGWLGLLASLVVDGSGMRDQRTALAFATEMVDIGRGGYQQ